MIPGDLVAGRFQIESLAGSGGFGAVFRARDAGTGRNVALKTLLETSQEDVARFARESQVLAELDHPGIVRYVAHGATERGVPFLAMEWLDGEDLRERLARGPLSLTESLALARRVAEALAAAHRRGVVHRDIKPANLFLPGGDPTRVTLLDFGIARRPDATLARTRTGTTLGTPGYMAPEQARGDRALSPRADVFSLGCVLFECLTGSPPFSGEHVMAVLAKILLEEPPRARALRPDVPQALDDLIAAMLAKLPEQRPADGTVLVAALDAITEPRSTGTPAAQSSSLRPALTGDELRLVCVVAVGGGARVAPDPRAATVITNDASGRDQAAVIAARFGARLERLADGSLVALLSGHGHAGDQATAAARYALALRGALPEGPIALATGRGMVDRPLPVGDVIERAAAMLGAATPAAVELDDTSADLLEGRFELVTTPAGRALRSARDDLDTARTLLGRPIPCVGREREIATLLATLDEVTGESVARAVLVTAPAGTGKSRLRQELVRRARERGEPLVVLTGRGDPIRATSPFGLLADAIQRAAEVAPDQPLAAQRRKLRGRVSRSVPEAEVPRVAAMLGEIAGIPFPDEESPHLAMARRDPLAMAEELRRAWEDFLRAECEAQPVLLVLEDLHWGDRATAGLVDTALGALAESPLMVLALARPEVKARFPGLWNERDALEIRLGPLTRKASEGLVRMGLAGTAADTGRIERLVQRAEGNALFLEELVRAEVEGRGEELPATVLAMVQSRVERLDGEARRALRAGSIFGETFWRGGVLELLGEGEGAESTPRVLDELCAREVISRHGGGRFAGEGEEEYRFRHALVRDAAYAMLTPADRALGHSLAGAWLERMGERDAATLAEHFELGGQPERALAWHRRAAEQAFEGLDFGGVVERAERGLRCGATGEVRGALMALACEAHAFRAEWREAAARGAEAIALSPRGSTSWCRAAAWMLHVGQGSRERAEALGRELVASPPTPAAASAHGQACAMVVRALCFAGEYTRSRFYLAHIEGLDPALLTSPARGYIASCASYLVLCGDGDPWRAEALLEESMRRFGESGYRWAAAISQAETGMALSAAGDLAAAQRALEEAIADAEREGNYFVRTWARMGLAEVLARRGAHVEAREVALLAEAAYAQGGSISMAGACRGRLAMAFAGAGDFEAAEGAARQAAATRPMGRPYRAEILALLSSILLRRGRADEALTTAESALELLGNMGEGSLVGAPVLLAHAEALAGVGRTREAAEVIARARQRLLAQAARAPDLEARARFLGAVAENARTLSLAEAWIGP